MHITPKNHEKTFDKDILLVTKTDLKGTITYANRAFIDIVAIDEGELIGSSHNIIRHPDMPKIIFKYLWQSLKQGEEIHAYVKNICGDGSYYWVFANVTPSYKFKKIAQEQNVTKDSQREIIGYHSSRRLPSKEALSIIEPLYKKLISAEASAGMNASEKILNQLLEEKGMKYEEFILSF